MTVTRGTKAPFPMQSADSTLARNIPVKEGTMNGIHKTVTIPTAVTDKIIGFTITDAYVVNQVVDVVGVGGGTVKLQVATGQTVTQGDLVCLDATEFSRIATLTYTAVTGATNRTILGRALETGTALKFIEVEPMLIPVTV